jgi:hypothetical protein
VKGGLMSYKKKKTLTVADIVDMQQEKRAAWLRDMQLVKQGVLRPEDLSWAHRIGFKRAEIDFSEATSATKRNDEDAAWADD